MTRTTGPAASPLTRHCQTAPFGLPAIEKMKHSRIFLIRHGDSRQDAVKRYIGQTDPALNADGIQQAQWCRRQLASVDFSHMYSSDLKRCRQTAHIITREDFSKVHMTTRLREIHLGAWENQPVDDIRKRFPEAYQQRGKQLDTYPPPGGESFSDLTQRIIPFFEQIAGQNDGNILIVTHAGVNRVILCHILGMPLINLFRLEIPYGSITMLVKTKSFFKLRAMTAPACHE